jgi:hypothetical protein
MNVVIRRPIDNDECQFHAADVDGMRSFCLNGVGYLAAVNGHPIEVASKQPALVFHSEHGKPDFYGWEVGKPLKMVSVHKLVGCYFGPLYRVADKYIWYEQGTWELQAFLERFGRKHPDQMFDQLNTRWMGWLGWLRRWYWWNVLGR